MHIDNIHLKRIFYVQCLPGNLQRIPYSRFLLWRPDYNFRGLRLAYADEMMYYALPPTISFTIFQRTESVVNHLLPGAPNGMLQLQNNITMTVNRSQAIGNARDRIRYFMIVYDSLRCFAIVYDTLRALYRVVLK